MTTRPWIKHLALEAAAAEEQKRVQSAETESSAAIDRDAVDRFGQAVLDALTSAASELQEAVPAFHLELPGVATHTLTVHHQPTGRTFIVGVEQNEITLQRTLRSGKDTDDRGPSRLVRIGNEGAASWVKFDGIRVTNAEDAARLILEPAVRGMLAPMPWP